MRCPACSFENPPGMRFCGQCATALVSSSSSGEERKLVTVLFADVVGSTHLSRAADPEQVRAQLARFFDIAREEIRRHEGTVEKFIGDAVMAVFGLPFVHENDPERAARAAVSLRARIRPGVESGSLPEIRIGISTGEVVADARAADKGDFLVTGEIVNLAARLEQHAEPGQILIGERTMRALGDAAQLRRVPPLTVKGLAVPLAAWELLEIAPPSEREVRATQFVGREEEITLLRRLVRRMRREGNGHVVTILGQAGVGKTRLVQEFRAQADDVRVLRGRALPYGTGVPFWALGEVIREECGILMSDPREVARRKLQETTARLDVANADPALLTVLGLGGEGHEPTREVLFSGMRSLFQAVARETPLLLILEDIHSAEDVTLDYVEDTGAWASGVPMLQLVLSRRELLERRPTWMEGKRGATTLFLDPLPGQESRELVRGIVGKPVPDPLLELVLDRAGGNPLFMVEMLRTLVEQKILTEDDGRWALTVPLSHVSIPDTVHAVIAARIDALPGPEKLTLQAAAIMGKVFWLGAVRFIADEGDVEKSLRSLVAKDILVHKRQSTLFGEDEYAFRHILIRDIAYTMVPKSRRWAKHARCADWLGQASGERRIEYADFVAHHWLQVIALRRDLGLPADDQARDQAVANLLVAGDHAAEVYASTTALDHYTRALELKPCSTARREALIGRGDVWMLLGKYERAREDFSAVRTLAREAGERRWEAVALDHIGHAYRQQDKIADALDHLEPALALSREVGDPSLIGRILNHVGFTYTSAARHKEAIRSHQEARRLLEGCRDLVGFAESLHGLGENARFLGNFREAIQWLSESAEACDRTGNRRLAGENLYMLAQSRHQLGDYAEAEAEAARSMATLAEINDAWNSSFALIVAARIATTLGQFDRALEYAGRGLSLARQVGAARSAVLNLQALSAVHRELEDHQGAWQIAREAVKLARVGEAGAFQMPLVLSSCALIETALGRTAEAQAHIEEAHRSLRPEQARAEFAHDLAQTEGRALLALRRPAEAAAAATALLARVGASDDLHWRLPAMLLLADALSRRGDPAAATRVYETIAGEAQAVGRTPVLWRALAGLAESQRALGEREASAASAGRTLEIVDHLAATVPDEGLRTGFLQSAKVQRVAELAGN